MILPESLPNDQLAAVCAQSTFGSEIEVRGAASDQDVTQKAALIAALAAMAES